MKIVETFPHPVRDIENVWVPMPDGCRLAARIWMPEDAEKHPVPAILEYIPYRKRDFTRGRDEPMHHYFAGHGYAAVRLDLRGSGDSDGVLKDEYTEQELDDAVAAIAWIASRPWCSGSIGMMGISWGGFNSLQVAALDPPALRAIITLCSTDDRYADDAHYMGGCLLNENLQWGSMFLHGQAYPPDPEIVGDRWRKMWRERLDGLEPFPAVWLEHQRRDDYWKHGSVCENFAAIRCAVYAIGGWADGYSNAIPRLLAGLEAPCKGLIGPWSHIFPHDGSPGPNIGFLQEAVRWWDHWLKGKDTGLMDEPPYRVWMQESVPPLPFHEERPGRWVAEDAWPSPRIGRRRYVINPGRLGTEAGPVVREDFLSPQTTGLAAGEWCGMGADGEAPTDQRPEDGRSLTFDSSPLPERLEILGAPVVTLDLAIDRPTGFVCVRLNDVAPDGASARVTYGLLNLTHRDGHETPVPLEPGSRYVVRLQLNDIAHAFPAGNRIRIAVSTSYWPIAWPSARPVTLSLHTGASALELPVRPPRPEDDTLRPFEPPEAAPGAEPRRLRPAPFKRSFERDLATNETVYTIYSDGGEFEGAELAHVEAIDLRVGFTVLRRYRIEENDPLSAQAEIKQTTMLGRGDWNVRIESLTRLTANRRSFRFEGQLDAWEGGTRFGRKRWDRRIPRDSG